MQLKLIYFYLLFKFNSSQINQWSESNLNKPIINNNNELNNLIISTITPTSTQLQQHNQNLDTTIIQPPIILPTYLPPLSNSNFTFPFLPNQNLTNSHIIYQPNPNNNNNIQTTIISAYNPNNQISYLPIPTITLTQTQIQVHTQTHLQFSTFYHTLFHTIYQTKTQLESTTLTKTQIQTETEIKTKTQTYTETETKIKTQTLTETEIKTKTQTEYQTMTKTQTLTESHTLIQTQTLTTTQIQLQTQTQTQTQTTTLTQTISLPPITSIVTNISTQLQTITIKPTPTSSHLPIIYQPVITSTVTIVNQIPIYKPPIFNNGTNSLPYNSMEFQFLPEMPNILGSCNIQGNPNLPCYGRCPPCWYRNPKTDLNECYSYINPMLRTCPNFENIQDVSSSMVKITPNSIREKGCFINGVKSFPCRKIERCPRCWNVNYKDQTFQCFDDLNGKCNHIENGVMVLPNSAFITNSTTSSLISPLQTQLLNAFQNSSNVNSPKISCILPNLNQECSGPLCPPCWQSTPNGNQCKDFQDSTYSCQSDQINVFSAMLYSRKSYYLTTTCYINNDSNQPCLGEQCPKCWKLDYNSKRAACYNKINDGKTAICPNIEGMLDLIKMGVFHESSINQGNLNNLANDSNAITTIPSIMGVPIPDIVDTSTNNDIANANEEITNTIIPSTSQNIMNMQSSSVNNINSNNENSSLNSIQSPTIRIFSKAGTPFEEMDK